MKARRSLGYCRSSGKYAAPASMMPTMLVTVSGEPGSRPEEIGRLVQPVLAGRAYAGRGRLNPSLAIRVSSVVGLSPSRSAAPAA